MTTSSSWCRREEEKLRAERSWRHGRLGVEVVAIDAIVGSLAGFPFLPMIAWICG
jgi:hypothetical protein